MRAITKIFLIYILLSFNLVAVSSNRVAVVLAAVALSDIAFKSVISTLPETSTVWSLIKAMVAASADNADPVSLYLNVPPVVVSWIVLLTPPVLTLAILK